MKDFTNGYMFSFAKRKLQNIDESIVFSLTQDIKSNEFKKHNILKAKSFIDHVLYGRAKYFHSGKLLEIRQKKEVLYKVVL